jgi:hypothetical protein
MLSSQLIALPSPVFLKGVVRVVQNWALKL